MGKREDNRLERREHIVNTARVLMRARNAAGFSMRTLAEAAGVSIATPYNLFGSKEAIIAAVMDADFADFQQMLRARATDPLEAFFLVIDVSAELFAAEPGFYKSGAHAIQTETSPELAAHFGEPRHLLLKGLVIDAVQRGFVSHQINPDSFAAMLGQQFFGWIQAWSREQVSLADMKCRARYGFALTLAAVVTATHRERMLEFALEQQAQLPESLRNGVNLGESRVQQIR